MDNLKIIFVCLGNICRSPLAEAIFKSMIKENSLEKYISVASCGTAGYHIGKNADSRSISIAAKYGLRMNHRAQKLDVSHFETYDYFIAMDHENVRNILNIIPSEASKKLHLMRDFDSVNIGGSVKDPWYGDDEGFQECYDVLDRCCTNFLNYILEKYV